MKSLNTYICEGFFGNVGAVPDVDSWIKAYNDSNDLFNIDTDYVDIDKYGRATIHPKAMYGRLAKPGYIDLRINDQNKDILFPDGALPPYITFSKEKWDDVEILNACNTGDLNITSMRGFPTKFSSLKISTPPSNRTVIMSNWMKKGVCKSLAFISIAPIDVDNLPKTQSLTMYFYAGSTAETKSDNLNNALTGLMKKWDGWKYLKEFKISIGNKANLTDENKKVLFEMDSFIKENYPEMYKHRSYRLIDNLLNNSNYYSIDMVFVM